MHYIATLPNGTKFDSSQDCGKPFMFTLRLGNVMRPFIQAVAQMSVGERATLICLLDYAYGPKGYQGVIPPNATRKINVELLAIH